jgi:hypothetical protein
VRYLTLKAAITTYTRGEAKFITISVESSRAFGSFVETKRLASQGVLDEQTTCLKILLEDPSFT